jgi:hypothetical protein
MYFIFQGDLDRIHPWKGLLATTWKPVRAERRFGQNNLSGETHQ